MQTKKLHILFFAAAGTSLMSALLMLATQSLVPAWTDDQEKKSFLTQVREEKVQPQQNTLYIAKEIAKSQEQFKANILHEPDVEEVTIKEEPVQREVSAEAMLEPIEAMAEVEYIDAEIMEVVAKAPVAKKEVLVVAPVSEVDESSMEDLEDVDVEEVQEEDDLEEKKNNLEAYLALLAARSGSSQKTAVQDVEQEIDNNQETGFETKAEKDEHEKEGVEDDEVEVVVLLLNARNEYLEVVGGAESASAKNGLKYIDAAIAQMEKQDKCSDSAAIKQIREFVKSVQKTCTGDCEYNTYYITEAVSKITGDDVQWEHIMEAIIDYLQKRPYGC